ncbi:MAG: polysaccharide deacetylase [Halorientalis sp.]
MTGVVTLSIEIELGWGMHDLGRYDHLSPRGERERAFLSRLLDACEAFDVPVSFDVVGHLLLDSCGGSHEGPHPDGWFAADPGTDVETDPLFYAPDAVGEIRRRPTDHELCTHTFSHVVCNRVDAAVVDRDLALAQSYHRERLGAPARTLVPPRHGPPPRESLDRAGIEVVRLAESPSSPTPVHRFKHLLVGPHPDLPPRLRDGVVETYGTDYMSLTASSLPLGQQSTHPAFRPLPVSLRQRLHERYLVRQTERVAATDGYLHLWCHLWDLSNEYQWAPIRAYLRRLGRLRAEGRVDVLPMVDLGRHVRRVAVDGQIPNVPTY